MKRKQPVKPRRAPQSDAAPGQAQPPPPEDKDAQIASLEAINANAVALLQAARSQALALAAQLDRALGGG
jgi:hypothetical protein